LRKRAWQVAQRQIAAYADANPRKPALRGVVVDTTHEERVEFRSGQQLWDWALNSNPIVGMIVGDLTEEQQATMRQVLDGMLRERTGGNGRTVLTAPLNIGVGTK
jgi:hypothetical protein